MYMLTGYKNGRDPAVLYYSAAACFASLVPEAAAQLLLQGDRFLANNDEIRQSMRDEFDYIGNPGGELRVWPQPPAPSPQSLALSIQLPI